MGKLAGRGWFLCYPGSTQRAEHRSGEPADEEGLLSRSAADQLVNAYFVATVQPHLFSRACVGIANRRDVLHVGLLHSRDAFPLEHASREETDTLRLLLLFLPKVDVQMLR